MNQLVLFLCELQNALNPIEGVSGILQSKKNSRENLMSSSRFYFDQFLIFSNFFCMFLYSNVFFQFEFELF